MSSTSIVLLLNQGLGRFGCLEPKNELSEWCCPLVVFVFEISRPPEEMSLWPNYLLHFFLLTESFSEKIRPIGALEPEHGWSKWCCHMYFSDFGCFRLILADEGRDFFWTCLLAVLASGSEKIRLGGLLVVEHQKNLFFVSKRVRLTIWGLGLVC